MEPSNAISNTAKLTGAPALASCAKFGGVLPNPPPPPTAVVGFMGADVPKPPVYVGRAALLEAPNTGVGPASGFAPKAVAPPKDALAFCAGAPLFPSVLPPNAAVEAAVVGTPGNPLPPPNAVGVIAFV